MWCSYHKTTTHNDADCHARWTNGLNGNAHFSQVRPLSVPGICSSWDLPVRDDSDEKPCISFLAREVQPAAKPAKVRVEEEKGDRPFGAVRTAATERWRTRPWLFIPHAEPQLATKPAKARVEEEKGARPFGPVSTAATERWRTRSWPFTPRAEQTISLVGPVAEEMFGMANDEEAVEKALMASSSVAVTSEDSANSNLATLMAPAEYLPGEVREPLSGEAATPLSGRASTPSGVRANGEGSVEKALMASSSVAVTSEDSADSNLATLMAPAESLPGEVREHLSGGASTPLSGLASTPSGGRASPETARSSPASVSATARTGGTIHNNNIHRPNVDTWRAAAELTGAVTRYKGVRPNRNNNDDDDIINNSNHAALTERFQPSTLHKLRQLGRYTNTDAPDTAHQLGAEAVPAEVAYTRTNTQPSCSGVEGSDRVPNIFKEGMAGLRHHTS